VRNLTTEEINGRYEYNTGMVIVEALKGTNVMAVPAVLCKNHGPFTWGKNPEEAVHNAVVLEELAKMASNTELINPKVQRAPQSIMDRHYYRKHGAHATYGQ
jgi:L-ribulose-5-phosphate 4-epimerase